MRFRELVKSIVPIRVAHSIRDINARGFYAVQEKLKSRMSFTPEEWEAIQAFRLSSFPEFVGESYALGKIINTLRLNFKGFSSLKDYDAVINFQDNTLSTVDVVSHMKNVYLYNGKPLPMIWNARCNDISKRRVGELFHDAFGYELEIDPTRYKGKCVKKSNLNATHDGVVIECPIARDLVDHKYSYTILVNNIRDHVGHDMRVVICKQPLPFFYYKRRPESTRFSNKNTFVTIETTIRHFSDPEVERIVKFCDLIGLDYGEIDCVRDEKSGLLYLLDVSKTPVGPPNGLSKRDASFAICEMSRHFARRFILCK